MFLIKYILCFIRTLAVFILRTVPLKAHVPVFKCVCVCWGRGHTGLAMMSSLDALSDGNQLRDMGIKNHKLLEYF